MADKPATAATADAPRESLGLRLRYAVFGLVFCVGYRLFGLRRTVIRENLGRSFPERDHDQLRRIRNDFVARQAETFAEIDYSRSIGAEELRQRVRLIDAALEGAPLAAAMSPLRCVHAGSSCVTFSGVICVAAA